MTRYIALLRAVNVGGTGNLPMANLNSMCNDAGFSRVETYIASGNVVFESEAAPSRVKAELEARLLAYAGKPVGVSCGRHWRWWPFSGPILCQRRSPSTHMQSSSTIAPRPMPWIMRLGNGMGRSKLRIPAAMTCPVFSDHG